MKKFFTLLVVAISCITMGFAQTTFQPVSFRNLDPDSKAVFQQTAKAHPYGQILKVEAEEILAAYEVTDVPSRSGRVETQYLIIFKDVNGQKRSILSTTRPNKDECLKCWISQCGYTTGSGPEFQQKEGTGENHEIPSTTPTVSNDVDDDIVIE